MTIPSLPERLANLPSPTARAIENHARLAYQSGLQFGMGQAAKSVQMRLAERHTEGYNDGWIAGVKAGVQALNALLPNTKE